MHDIQKATLFRYGYRGDARTETWHRYDDGQLIAVDAEELKTRLEKWNQEIVHRRVKELRIANGELEKTIASNVAREAAVDKLTEEDKAVLCIRPEDFGAQRGRYIVELVKNEALITKLTTLPLQEIMHMGLVEYWWNSEPADIKTFQEFEAELSLADGED